MAKTPRSLILAFIDRQPDTASRVLATMDPSRARALLADIPARYAARVVTRMGPWLACARLRGMEAETAAAILRGVPHQSTAALLRLMADPDRQAILRELPKATRRDLRTTLRFPADTVGASMTTEILTQLIGHTVADARDQLREATRADTGCVVIVDEQRRFAGLVRPVQLLSSRGGAPLAELMDRGIRPLSASARLATVEHLEGWNRYLSLPVVGRQRTVIGVLSVVMVRQSSHSASQTTDEALAPLPAALTDAFLNYLGGVAFFAAAGQNTGGAGEDSNER